jgi:hypothetical protein
MTSSVRSFLPVSGDPTALRRAFVGDPTRWLPDARHVGPDRWTLTVRAGQLSRTVEARLGAPWRAGGSQWRSLSWDPVVAADEGGTADRLLPSFDGELGLHVLNGVVTLMLDARYRPPGGPVGAALDGVALQRVARATVERLLADVAARLTAESLLTTEAAVPTTDDEPKAMPVT